MNQGSLAPQNVPVYIGLGSNLANPIEQVRSGIAAIMAIPGVKPLACSALYASAPMGPQDQPDYVNAVLAIETALSPEALLAQLQSIETRHGRVRQGQRWGARSLDLDILLYGQEIIVTPDLIIPHYGISERSFVLTPLAEIAPNITIPGKGPIEELLENCHDARLRRID